MEANKNNEPEENSEFKERISDYNVEIVEQTMVNGRVNFRRTAANPIALKRVTYNNETTGKNQIQSYLEMEDLVVPVIIKKDKKTEKILFALQYEALPSSEHYSHLELPDCPFFDDKKDHYSNEDVIKCIDNNMRYLGLEMLGYKYLDYGETAINQSITDQLMRVACVYVEETETNNSLVWYPISCLADFLEERRLDKSTKEFTTITTKYALRLFYKAFESEIKKEEPTKFYYDRKLIDQDSQWSEYRIIMPHKYRFGEKIVSKEYSDVGVANLGDVYEIGTSKNSVECLLVKVVDGKKMIGLSKQQRSPFIERKGVDEFFYEEVGGMIEDGEDYEEALRREVVEETGIQMSSGKLTQLTGLMMIGKGTQEASIFYLYEMDGSEIDGDQSQDEQESIEKIEWFDLDQIDLNTFHAPLPTKYAVLLAREYFERAEKKEKHNDSYEREK